MSANDFLTSATGAGIFSPRLLRPAASLVPGSPVISTNLMQNTEGTTGGSTGYTTWMSHKIVAKCTNLQLVYFGWRNHYLQSPNEYPVGATQPVKASIEINGNGTRYPVSFAGVRTGNLEGYGVLASNPIGITLNPGDIVKTRVFQNLPLSTAYLQTMAGNSAPGYSSGTDGYTAGDTADSGGSVTVHVGPWGNPLLFAQSLDVTAKSVFVIGDSIVQGVGDTNVNWGWVQRLINGTLGVLRLGVPGISAQQIAGMIRWQALAPSCTHAIVQLGRNDMGGRTALQVQGDLTTIYQALADRGVKVYGAPILPQTTSTDAWATVANQTVVGGNSTRIAVNAWIRSKPAPLSGVLDACAGIEANAAGALTQDGAYWSVAAGAPTTDGTHPTPAAAAAIASALSLSILV